MPDRKLPPRQTTPAERGRTLWKPGRSSRMKAGLVGLSSAAIVSVYAAGYLNTRADTSSTVVPADAVVSSVSSTPTTVPAPTRNAGGSTAPTLPQNRTAATPTPAPAKTTAYKDGTYTGIGSSRHGSIQATVVIEGGKIVSANITGCGTKYPCSKVASLPGQVVARQTASVNHVSGATDSSNAYMGAVAAALAQAKA